MAEKKFSIGEAIGFGWDKTINNLLFFVGILIVAYLIPTIPNAIAELVKKHNLLYIIFSILSLLSSLLIQLGLIRIGLRFCDNEKAKFVDLFSGLNLPLFLKYLFASILFILIILLGLILLIIPGIILALKFQFYGYFIVDKNSSPLEALKKSAQITRGAKGDLFIFWLAAIGIILLGLLALVIGLCVAQPITLLASAFIYRALLAKTEGV